MDKVYRFAQLICGKRSTLACAVVSFAILFWIAGVFLFPSAAGASAGSIVLSESDTAVDETDTFLTRDVMYITVFDTDEADPISGPLYIDSVIVTVYVGDNVSGLILDTESFNLSENSTATVDSAIFRSRAIVLTDTLTPIVDNQILSWGRSDTLHAHYPGRKIADNAFDTALAIEIATTGVTQFFEDAVFTDDVDTYSTRDVAYIQVIDTDENRNPQTKDTVLVTVYVGNGAAGGGTVGSVLDTETVLLTESGETTGIFRSAGILAADTRFPFGVNNGLVEWGRSDTVQVVYTDVTGTSENSSDTALAIEIATTSVTQLFEDAGFTDDVDTFLTRDYFYVQVIDTDENRNPQAKDTIEVDIYTSNGTAGGGVLGLVLDTDVAVITETGETTGVFRSSVMVLADTQVPVVDNGILSWGRSDTLHVTYTDIAGTSETTSDTALALEIASTAGLPTIYEDAAYTDDVDTLLTRDVMYVQVIDTDENRNPQSKDTLNVTVYVGNGTTEGGSSAGLVIDTLTLTLTESTETTGVFQSGAVVVSDTQSVSVTDGVVSLGRNDTMLVDYTDVTGTSETKSDTALALEIATGSVTQIFEESAYTDDVDTFLTRDMMFIQVIDTDENHNPQLSDTVQVTVYVGNSAGIGTTGLVLDTEVVVMTESSATSGIFRATSSGVIVTDTKVPLINDGHISWGASDTIHVSYTDLAGTSDNSNDTALALEIATNAAVQFYEDAAFTDDVDTYFQKNDVAYIRVFDTDENRNPQSKETVTVTVYVDDGNLMIDTENFTLTESGETTGIFQSAAINIVDTDADFLNNNGRIAAFRSDTFHLAYIDANNTTDIRSDTAFIDTPAATASLTQIFEDAAFTDEVDTLQTRDYMYIQVTDTDKNKAGGETETVNVTVYVSNGSAEGGVGANVILDTETLVLTEASATSSFFRSAAVVVTDTLTPVVNDGKVSWGRSDTMRVVYTDPNSTTDTSSDTALALEIVSTAKVVFYEDAAFTDEVDTFRVRDAMYVAVYDTDENRNPNLKDTVTTTVYVGNGTTQFGYSAGLVLDTETLTLTESGETTGVFRSGAVQLTDTKTPAVNDGQVSWGQKDTMAASYTDVTGTSESTSDTALGIIFFTGVYEVKLYEDAAYADEIDTLSTRDVVYIQLEDIDDNENPQAKDTWFVTVWIGNGSAVPGTLKGRIIDSEIITLTETGETTGIFRSGVIVVTDTVFPVVKDGTISWGVDDTMFVVDLNEVDPSDTTSDTALAIEIATAGNLQFYENSGYTDDVDTFVVRNDDAYIQLVDTDENRNPQSVETITITVTVANAGLKDTESTIVLTESGETTGIFRSGTLGIVDSDTAGQFVNNGRLGVGVTGDTLHATYTDANGTSETKSDTALIVAVPAGASLTELFENTGFTDVVDTFLTRDLMFIQVTDTDENSSGLTAETVYVTVYVFNGAAEGGVALNLIIDTDIIVLTENGSSNGAFRSTVVVLTDTLTPTVNDGRVSWGRGDTMFVIYNDENDATDTSTDTALALEIVSTAEVTIYEDASYTDEVDTLLTRDVMYVAVFDTDENRNPNLKDTVTATVYVGNGTNEGTATGLVLDTLTLTLTESGETTGAFRSGVVVVADTQSLSVTDGVLSWGRSDTLIVTYSDVTGTSETDQDTALALEIASGSVTQIFEEAGFSDEVDTLLTRDLMFIQVIDTDANHNPQVADTVSATIYVGNATAGSGAAGLVLDTEVLTLTETTKTSGTFRLGNGIVVTDTKVPAVNDTVVSWGVSDTLQVSYTDAAGTSETSGDTALALEIASTANIQFYENSAYTDDVDTFVVRNDDFYVELVDTDENRNPQSKETITITVTVATGLKDTETIVLTESGETTGVFRSGTISIVDSDTAGLFANNGRIGVGTTSDTLHAGYTDANGTTETKFDSALIVAVPNSSSLTEIFIDAGFTDVVDTLLTRSLMYIQVTDTDENAMGGTAETVYVTVYVFNGAGEGGFALNLILDTDVVVLTENGSSNGAFRSAAVVVTDTLMPVVNDGKVSWGRNDTMFVIYNDENDATDTSTDTALALEIATTAEVTIYEDASYTDEVDTLLTRDVMYVAVFDTDENRNPTLKDTVTATVYVGNGTNEGTATGLVLDTLTLTLTESGETTGAFRSGVVVVADTQSLSVTDGVLSWGRSDTLIVTYSDVTGTIETDQDTALALEIATSSVTQIFENGAYSDEVDTLLTRDIMFLQVIDTDANHNPQVADTVRVTVYAGNATAGGGAAGLVLDTEVLTLTESSATSGTFRSDTIVVTDTKLPTVNDGVVTWGASDTLTVSYTDLYGTSETSSDTALALEIASTANVQFYENSTYTDDVDTFVVRNDDFYVELVDTDENRNPQSKETITITVTVATGLKDTETIVLTESGETTGVFRSGTISIVDSDTAGLFANNGRIGVGTTSDTLHAGYTDANGTTETKFDSALIVAVPPSSSLTELFEDAGFTDVVDTFLTRDLLYIQVTDTDENAAGGTAETVYVTVYVCNGTAEGGYAAGLILDTEVVVLTENGSSNGAFRSAAVVLIDTLTPTATDGKVSWGRSDTMFVIYNDENDATDTSTDTALALEIASTADVTLYEDASYADDIDTLQIRDAVYIAVVDTDENRNPNLKDTITVTAYVGNGTSEGGSAAGLVLDTEILTLTESAETSGVFRSGAVAVTDTGTVAVSNGVVNWGRNDTLAVVYSDVTGSSETDQDTALALEIASTATAPLIYEDAAFTDEVDTLLTRDVFYIQLQDTDENRNPHLTDTIGVFVYVGNATAGGGAAGLVLDTELVVLTEIGATAGVFRSVAVNVTDTTKPAASDGKISWGAGDTLQVVYTDVAGTSETTNDTALALEIASTASVQFYEENTYTDDVDTYIVNNDNAYIQVVDTDENRNPQLAETITITVTAATSTIVNDTETIVLTESGETTGIFRSGAITITKSDIAGATNNNGRIRGQISDSVHASYTDANGTVETKSDTALLLATPAFIDNGNVTVYVSSSTQSDSSEPDFDSTAGAYGGIGEAMSALNPSNGFDTIVIFVSSSDSYTMPAGGISVDTGITIISHKALYGSDNGGGGDTFPTVTPGPSTTSMFTVDSGARFEGFTINGLFESSRVVTVNKSGAGPNRASFINCTVRNIGYAVYGGSNANNIEITNCTAVNLSKSAVEFSGASVRIEKCYAENITDSVISQSGGSGSAVILDNVIKTANNGIILTSTDNFVARNKIFSCTGIGIKSTAASNIIHANEIHNSDTGVDIGSGGSLNEVKWNNIYSCTTFIKNAAASAVLKYNYYGKTDLAAINSQMSLSVGNFTPYRFAKIDTRVASDSIATDVPDTVAIDTGTANKITVRWQTPGKDEDGSAVGAVSYYKVFRLKDAADTTNWIGLTPLSDTSFTDTFVVDNDIVFGSTYYYRVVAVKSSTGETSWLSDTKTALPIFSGAGVIRLLTPGGAAATTYKARHLDSVVIEVNDSDPNKNPGSKDDTVVTLVNLTYGTDTEIISITEVGLNFAIFSGTAALSSNITYSGANDGILFVRGGDVIRAIYRDVSSTIDRTADATMTASGNGVDSIVDLNNDQDTQMGAASAALSQAFVVAVYDTAGDSMQSTTVTWSVSYNGGSFVAGGGGSAGGSSISSSSTTDAQGKANATLTLGSSNGFYMVKASAPRSNGGTSEHIFVAYTDKRDIPLSTTASPTWTMFSPHRKPTTGATGRNQLAVSAGSLSDLIIYTWNPSTSTYKSVTGQPSPNVGAAGEFSTFEAGKSYWILDKTSAKAVGLASGSTASDSPQQILVYTGWNMIANPYGHFIDWQLDVRIDTTPSDNTNDTVAYRIHNVDTTSGNKMHGKIYWREGSSYAFGPSGVSNASNEGSFTSYDTTVMMKPLAGYWMKIFGECSAGCSLVFQPTVRIPSSSKAKAAAPKYDGASSAALSNWSMNMKASGGGLSDDYTYVGVAPGAKEGYDVYTAYKAPAIGDYVQVSVREGKDAQSPAYAASMVPQITTAQTWGVEVGGSKSGPVTLSWDASGIPAGFAAYLLGAGAPVDMTKTSSVVVVLASSVNLQMAVGLPEYLTAFLSSPLSKEESFVFPNPGPDAAGNVNFKYNLQAATDVKIKIYDVGGKLVKEMTHNGIAGSNTAVWDSTNKNGQKVGSGVYIYIIEGSGAKLIDKLAIVR